MGPWLAHQRKMLVQSLRADAGPQDMEKVNGPLLGRRSKSGRPTDDDSWWADEHHCDGPTSVHLSLAIWDVFTVRERSIV